MSQEHSMPVLFSHIHLFRKLYLYTTNGMVSVVPPYPRVKWTSPSRNLFLPELGMSSHGLGNLSLYSTNRLERQCWMSHGMRNEFYLRSRTGVRASFIALRFAEGSESTSSRQTEGKLS